MTNAATCAKDTHVTPRLSYYKDDGEVENLHRSTHITTHLKWIRQQIEKLCCHRTPEYITLLTVI